MFLVCEIIYLLSVLPFEKSTQVQKRKLLLAFGSGDLRGFTIVDLNDHAVFEAIWRLSRNETHSLCPQYIDFIYTFSLSSPFCTRNPPAQLKQFSMFCFDLILRGKFKRSKIALLLVSAVLWLIFRQANNTQGSFINHVDTFLDFFNPLPLSQTILLYMSYIVKQTFG